jgi:hypothetical protein
MKLRTLALEGVKPLTYERRGAPEDRAPDSSPAIGAWPAVSVETLHLAEIKHAPRVESFHGMQSFHVVAACGTAAPANRAPGRPRTAQPPPS